MKIALIGATGGTGRQVAEQALARGHGLRVLARNPEGLGDLAGRVEVVPGDVLDAAAVASVVTGTDAVVSALGPRGKQPGLHARSTPLVVDAMKAAGVRRYVGVTGAGIDRPGDRKSGRDRVISFLIQRLGGAVIADRQTEAQLWADSGLDWTLVRAPRLQDGEATGALEHHASQSPATTVLRRSDLATFVLDLAEGGDYVGAAPFVAEARGARRR